MNAQLDMTLCKILVLLLGFHRQAAFSAWFALHVPVIARHAASERPDIALKVRTFRPSSMLQHLPALINRRLRQFDSGVMPPNR